MTESDIKGVSDRDLLLGTMAKFYLHIRLYVSTYECMYVSILWYIDIGIWVRICMCVNDIAYMTESEIKEKSDRDPLLGSMLTYI
jgi:hypothetical protein